MKTHSKILAAGPVDLTKPGTISCEVVQAEGGERYGVLDIVGALGSGYNDIASVEVVDKIKVLVVDGCKEIQVRITSYGGCLYTALAIYDALRAASAAGVTITGRVYGVAASAATVVLMGCDKREMSPKSEIMIHEPSTCIYGKVSEMQADLDSLRECWERMCSIYAERTGRTAAEIAAAHTSDVWYTSEQALAGGWVDAIFTDFVARSNEAETPESEEKQETEQEPEQRSLFAAARDLAARFGLCPPRQRAAAVDAPNTEKLLAEAVAAQERLTAEMDGMRALLAAAQDERAAMAAERDAARADRQADIEREVAARVASMGMPLEAELPSPAPSAETPSAFALVADAEVQSWLAAGQHDRVISYACRSAEANMQVSRLLNK